MDAHRDFLNALMEAKPDITLSAVLERLAKDRGQASSRIALSRFYRREGWRFKKSLRAAEQERPDVARLRRRWRGFQRFIDVDRLVLIDETGLNTKMTRLYGRARGGDRCIGDVPHGHWRTSTFICGLRRTDIAAPSSSTGR